MSLEFFSSLTRSWELSVTVLVALDLIHSIYECLPDFPFLFLQNQMLDYSKRSRSGKFRLVTKFKKEKNNKNKETHSSMGLPGTESAHSLRLFGTSVVTALRVLCLFPLTFSPSSVSCASVFSWRSSLSFPCGKVAYCSILSHGPLVPHTHSWAETGGTLWRYLPLPNLHIFRDILGNA